MLDRVSGIENLRPAHRNRRKEAKIPSKNGTSGSSLKRRYGTNITLKPRIVLYEYLTNIAEPFALYTST